MTQLYDTETNKSIGAVTDAQLAFLVEQLEEESSEDQDYYIDAATLDWFEDEGGDAALVKLLRLALGHRDGMEIRWKKE